MRRIALIAALLIALPAAAESQTRLLLGGGITTPNGDFADGHDAGIHGRVGLHVGIPVFPLGVRAEGELHRLDQTSGGGGTTSILGGAVSGVFTLGGIGVQPYVLGGFGRYRIDGGVGAAETASGIHGGFGATIGALGLGGFAEIRVVNIDTLGGTTRYIPVTVGFRF